MTRRPSMQAQLDAAVERNVVTLVRGLPRVGRSSLLADWMARRTDARRATVADLGPESGIFILDHVDEGSVGAIIALVRAADEAKARTRLVIAPGDLRTAERLRTTLPGVVDVIEVAPLSPDEVGNEVPLLSMAAGPVEVTPTASVLTNGPLVDPQRHWLRGGLPESLTEDDDAISFQWRRSMLDALLARDYTEWGVERAFPLGDVLRWLANQNGGELDENSCPFAKRQDLKSAVYVLELLGIVRRLRNFPMGGAASMGRKHKVFVRDSGLLHASLGIVNWTQLRSHNAIGGSFETYAIEALILAGGGRCGVQFYREKGADGEDEIDLVLDFPARNRRLVAIEFKVGEGQSAKKGFHAACQVLDVYDRFVVHSGDASFMGLPVDRLNLRTAVERVVGIAREA